MFLRRFCSGIRLNVLQSRVASDQIQDSSLVVVDIKMVAPDAEAYAFALDWIGAGRSSVANILGILRVDIATCMVRDRNNDSNLD